LGGEEILQVASCYRNWEELWPNEPLMQTEPYPGGYCLFVVLSFVRIKHYLKILNYYLLQGH